MTKSIDTIIFDLDGTLLNTLGDLYESFNHAISFYGYPTRTLEEIKSFVGNGIKKAIERALPNNVDDLELENIVKEFKSYYMANMNKHTKPYDGIIELLEYLKTNGYKLAVVSNKFDDGVKQLNHKYFSEYINVAIGEGYGVRRKPEADGVLKAIKELNSNINNCIYIGDSEVDILTAKNCNIPCISVLWGFKDKEFLLKNGASHFANTPNDIINILSKL